MIFLIPLLLLLKGWLSIIRTSSPHLHLFIYRIWTPDFLSYQVGCNPFFHYLFWCSNFSWFCQEAPSSWLLCHFGMSSGGRSYSEIIFLDMLMMLRLYKTMAPRKTYLARKCHDICTLLSNGSATKKGNILPWFVCVYIYTNINMYIVWEWEVNMVKCQNDQIQVEDIQLFIALFFQFFCMLKTFHSRILGKNNTKRNSFTKLAEPLSSKCGCVYEGFIVFPSGPGYKMNFFNERFCVSA